MVKNDSTRQVIQLAGRLRSGHAAPGSPPAAEDKPGPTVITISSGKGGVGKTNIVANLGFYLSRMGRRTLVMDADLGLGNMDILLGLIPKYNLSHVIAGRQELGDIILPGPRGIHVLPAGSGLQELTRLTPTQRETLLGQMAAVIHDFDVVLIDTAAGISEDVLFFNASAQEVIVVTTPDLTAITDAYALMKVLSLQHAIRHFSVIVNQVPCAEDADRIFIHLTRVAQRFLNISMRYVGHVLQDRHIALGMRQQRLVAEIYPESPAARCLERLAKTLCHALLTT